MCKTEMFVEMVLRVTRMRSKSVQKIGVATCIIGRLRFGLSLALVPRMHYLH
jgi:hypothetical protein